MNVLSSCVALAVVAAMPLSAAFADRLPPDVKPMVTIVKQLEDQGYGPFTEVSFDDGYWEVEVYKDDAALELAVDGQTGKITSEHPDDAEPRPQHDAQPLSQILQAVIKAGYSDMDEVSFERRYWEIECLREDGKFEIHVDPTTGEIISERRDD